VHIYILGPKLLHWTFFKSLSYLHEVVRITFPLIFGLFAIFDRNFAKIVAPPSNENDKYVVHLKEQPIPKKELETASKSTLKSSQNTCLNCVPHAQEEQA